MKMGCGKERAITVGVAITVLLGLFQPFVSVDAAVSIQYAKGLTISAAFLMSVLLAFNFFLLPGSRQSD